MRISTFALALTLAALGGSTGAMAQAKRPAKQPAAQEPAPPPLFACRTQEEVCFLGIVVGDKVAVLFTNAPNGQGAEEKPLDVTGAGGKIDMSKDNGRVVMLTGGYDPKAGITNANVVEVASPLQSLVLKAQIVGQQQEPAPKGGAKRR